MIAAITDCIRETANAIVQSNLPHLEESVRRQQELTLALAANRTGLLKLAETELGHFRDLAVQQAVLSRVLPRCSRTVQSLLSLSKSDDSFYSLETLPRR